MEGNTDFSAEHLNVLAVKALARRVVHTAQELAAIDARLGRQPCQIHLVVLGFEVSAALATQAGLEPGQDAVNLLLDCGVRLGLDTGHEFVLLDHGVTVHLR